MRRMVGTFVPCGRLGGTRKAAIAHISGGEPIARQSSPRYARRGSDAPDTRTRKGLDVCLSNATSRP